jgi:hypothetical protein
MSHQFALEHSKKYTEYKRFNEGKGIEIKDTINKQKGAIAGI